MELTLRKINVREIAFGSTTKINNGVLTISKNEIKNLILEDERISEVKIDIARPGESIRIIPVKDVIEPRAKLNGDAFPGIDGAIEDVGNYYRTHSRISRGDN